MPSSAQRTGAQGEAEAERYLRTLGYGVIDRHFTCRFGELDLVATDQKELVFIEVKQRRSVHFGTPEESITRRKLERLASAIEVYRSAHPEFDHWTYRLDLIIIDESNDKEIRHLRGLSPQETSSYSHAQ